MTTHRDNCPRCILDDLLRKATSNPKDRARRFGNVIDILGYTPEHEAAAHARDDEPEADDLDEASDAYYDAPGYGEHPTLAPGSLENIHHL